MFDNVPIKLNTESILTAPLNVYENDFTFYVNGESFVTSRIIADLLSTVISKMHMNDPTICRFELATKSKGNFSSFLNLINFEQQFIEEEEIEYFTEIIEILQTDSITIQNPNKIPITLENVFQRIQKHEKSPSFYSKPLSDEIDFISCHFFEFSEKEEKQIQKLTENSIERIIENPKLQLKSEDQLLSFINELYLKKSSFSQLFEYVEFKNVSTSKIIEFLKIFNIDDLSNKMWKTLSNRLQQQIVDSEELYRKVDRRYHKNGIPILFKEKHEFDGIIKYIQNHTEMNSNEIIDITSSSVMNNKSSRSPKNVISFDDRKFIFTSENVEDSWICFDFIDKKVTPLNYSIRSCSSSISCANPRSWVVEGSNDKKKWDVIDEQENSQFLNGSNLVRTFVIQNPVFDEFRYLRLRQTAPNWCDNCKLYIDSIEFFGYLI